MFRRTLFVLLGMLLSVSLAAQSFRGTIQGTVTDASGAAIPGAEVKISSPGRNAVATIKEICNVAFLQGNIGKPGAGLFPVRGHSNVQGDRTMGIWERPPAHFLDAIQQGVRLRPAP